MSARDEAHAEALDAIHETGQRTPCQHPGAWRTWISELPEDRDKAVAGCLPCSLLDPCRGAGRRERAGVWGAVDRLPTKARGDS